MSYLLYDGDTETPWAFCRAMLSSSTASVGPDLMGDDRTGELTEALSHTVRYVFMALPDDVMIYPCHGAGSACGPNIGDRMSSTIGYERRFNDYAKIETLDQFEKAMQADAPPVPTHCPRLKKVNAEGPDVMRNLPRVPPLTVDRFAKAVESGAQVLDVRDMMAFGAGHLIGAINIGARPELSVWAVWLLDPERPIHDDADLTDVVKLLWRTGFTEFGGYLAGGMSAWREAGQDFAQIPQISVHELKDAEEVTPLDVRKPDEWEGGHVPGAVHVFLGELGEKMDGLDRGASYATYCASGFRASIAASLLAAEGFKNIRNVPGS